MQEVLAKKPLSFLDFGRYPASVCKHTCVGARQTSDSGTKGFRLSFRNSLGPTKVYSPLTQKGVLICGGLQLSGRKVYDESTPLKRSSRVRPALSCAQSLYPEHLTGNTFHEHCSSIQIPVVQKANSAQKLSRKRPGVPTILNVT